MVKEYKHPLEERLLQFSVGVIKSADNHKSKEAAIYLRRQLLRSGTSASLNYSESLAAESRKDFVHKLRISLKELRETHINLRMILLSDLTTDIKETEYLSNECNQLIAILVKSVQTLRENSSPK